MDTSIGAGRQIAFLLLGSALGLGGCAGGPTDELPDEASDLSARVTEPSNVEDVGTQTSELKNGTVFDGSGWSRGAVLLEIYWPNLGNGFWTKCSGQIVSKRSILTAAHCIQPVGNVATWVFARRPTPAGWVDVIPGTWTTVRYNPAFDGISARHDVGLVITNNGSSLVGAVEADAAKLSKTTPSGVSMTAFGYGYYTDTQFDGQGRYGALTPTYNTNALEYYWWGGNANSPKICTIDSGGPLKSNHNGFFLTYGVASGGSPGAGECRANGYWATTANNMTWLKNNIVGAGACFETGTMLACW